MHLFFSDVLIAQLVTEDLKLNASFYLSVLRSIIHIMTATHTHIKMAYLISYSEPRLAILNLREVYKSNIRGRGQNYVAFH